MRQHRPIVLVAAMVGALALTGCPSSSGSDESTDSPAPSPEAPEESAVPTIECALTSGELLIDSIRLTSDDGTCSLYLPATVTSGEYGIAISAAGADDSAAVEGSLDGQRLIASGGSVTIDAVSDGQISGTIDAIDENPPGTGRFSGSFDVQVPDL